MLVAHDAVLGIPRGCSDFKARSIAKERTNELQSGGRDPGVSRPDVSQALAVSAALAPSSAYYAFSKWSRMAHLIAYE